MRRAHGRLRAPQPRDPRVRLLRQELHPDPRQALAEAGLDAHRLKDEGGAGQPGLHLGTMHRAKGLEFKAVLAVSCSQGVMPNPRTLSLYGDPVDREDAAARELRLLYVVMTRARDELVVSWVGRPSSLLKAVLNAL